jgi:hypothetical protein
MSKLDELPHHSCLKAIIIYDNFAFAAKANERLQGAASRADALMRWDVKPWRVDALELHRGAEEALADAADAHLIVFAGHRAQALPSRLLNWLERWVACRQIADAAFAVMGGRNGDVLSMPTTPELTRFAERHGLDFIIDEESVANNEEEFLEHEAPEDTIPALVQSRFMDMPKGISYRGWGIND